MLNATRCIDIEDVLLDIVSVAMFAGSWSERPFAVDDEVWYG